MREAEIWPRREAVSWVPGGGERSRLMEVDCLSAVLKRVFWKRGLISWGVWHREGWVYHDGL